jgi:hypothetical protein
MTTVRAWAGLAVSSFVLVAVGGQFGLQEGRVDIPLVDSSKSAAPFTLPAALDAAIKAASDEQLAGTLGGCSAETLAKLQRALAAAASTSTATAPGPAQEAIKAATGAPLPFCGIDPAGAHYYAGGGEWVAKTPQRFQCKGPPKCAQQDYHYTKNKCDPKKAAQG